MPTWAAVAARDSGYRRITTLTWAVALASVVGTATVAVAARAATADASRAAKPALHPGGVTNPPAGTLSLAPSPTDHPASHQARQHVPTQTAPTPSAATSAPLPQPPITQPAPPVAPPATVSSGS